MLFFTDRNCFLTAVRVYANAGFDCSWRLQFPLLAESCDFIEELFSDYGSPVLESVDSKKGRGKRLVIPASAEYFAAAFSDPDWRRIYAVVFSRKPLPDREHCRCQRNDSRANPICRLDTIPEDVIFKPLEGKKEHRKFIQFSWKEESSCALAHALLLAVTAKNMEAYDILFRLTELWKFCDNKFPRIFANCLTEAWQKTFHENPPVPFCFNPAETDFRKCIRSVVSPEDFLEDLKAKREKWLLERPVLQKFFAENPAETCQRDIKALTFGTGEFSGRFRDAYSFMANELTREPEGLPVLENFITELREGREIVPEDAGSGISPAAPENKGENHD